MPADLSKLSRGELIDLLYQQAREIEILKEMMVALQEKLEQKDTGNGPSKPLPSFVKPNVKKKKRQAKRKRREHGFFRKLETPTETIFHSFDACPDCGEKHLGKPSVSYTRQIIDIPKAVYDVIEHVIFKRYCFNCEKRVSPKVDLSSFVIGKGRIGINLMAAVFTMKEEADMTVNKIQKHLKTFYGLDLSLGEIIEILHQESGLGKGKYEEIKQGLLASRVIYADETGGREDGKNGYHWSFSNEKSICCSTEKAGQLQL
jgi:transposase